MASGQYRTMPGGNGGPGRGSGVAPKTGRAPGVGASVPNTRPSAINNSQSINSTSFQPFAGRVAVQGAGGLAGPKYNPGSGPGEAGQFKSPVRKAMADAKRTGPSRLPQTGGRKG